MTHEEDIKRIKENDYQEYLHYRINALEKRVEFLEAQLEVAKHIIK